MERLGKGDSAFPKECFFCAARVFIDGAYYCNPHLLTDKNIILPVARYKPSGCPLDQKLGNSDISPQIQLRKLLGK